MSGVIEVHGLRMVYGSREVLAGVDFEVRRGQVICLLGPNGAGRTTTIEILEWFRLRSSGQVTVLGLDPTRTGARASAWSCSRGAIIRAGRPGACSASSGRTTSPTPPARSSARPSRGAARDGGPPRPRRPEDRDAPRWGAPARRRGDRPELLFLDEPTAGFDPHAHREFHDLVHRLADLEQTSILLTTHDLDEAEKLADRILILTEGRIVADASGCAAVDPLNPPLGRLRP